MIVQSTKAPVTFKKRFNAKGVVPDIASRVQIELSQLESDDASELASIEGIRINLQNYRFFVL